MRGLRKYVFVSSVIFVLLILPALTYSYEPDSVEGADGPDQVIKAREFFIGSGFEGISLDGGGETVNPYGNLDPHLHLVLEYLQAYDDSYLDLNSSYSGRDYHDLDIHYHAGSYNLKFESKKFPRYIKHLSLPAASDTSASPLYNPEDQDPAAQHVIDLSEITAFAKAAIPGYPAHVRVEARRYTAEGSKQQAFLNENCTTNCHNISRTRKIRTVTDQISLGGDAHLGIADFSYHYKQTKFSDKKPAPAFTFGTVTGLTRSSNNHNDYPDMKSIEHRLTASTNLTGKVSGVVGVGLGERKNQNAGISEDYRLATGHIRIRPSRKISVVLDSSQILRQDDSPPASVRTVKIADGLPLEFGTLKTRYRATANYYPGKAIKVRSDISRTEIEREDNAAWSLPGKSCTDRIRVLVQIRPDSELKLKFSLEDLSTDNPSFNTTPTDSRRHFIDAQWNPGSGITFLAGFKDFSDESSVTGRTNDRLLFNAGVGYSPSPPLVLGFYFYRFEDDVNTDLTFDGPSPVTDSDVPYRAQGTQYLVQASFRPEKRVKYDAEISLLDSKGSFTTDQAPFTDAGSYSLLDAFQLESSLGITYWLSSGWAISTEIRRLQYEDNGSSSEDETINKIAAMLSKRW